MWKIARSLRFARSISQYALPLRPFQHHSLLHPYLHRQSRVLQCRWLSCAYIPTGQPSLFQSSQPDYRQDIQTGKSIRDYRLWFRYDERVERNHWQWRDFWEWYLHQHCHFWLDSDRVSDRAEDDTYIDATDKVVSILRFCKEAKFRKEIFELLGVTYQFKNFKAFIEPLLQHDYLELTVPDKPTSPKQQYRTTKRDFCSWRLYKQ